MLSCMRVGLVVAMMLVGWLVVAPASAAEPGLSISAEPAYAEERSVVTFVDTAEDGTARSGATITVERYQDGAWTPAGAVVTDAEGRASLEVVMSRVADENRIRASEQAQADAGTAAPVEAQLPLKLRTAKLRLQAPSSVRDENAVTITLAYTTGAGTPVAGPVVLQRRTAGTTWRTVARLTTDQQGAASWRTRPRVDTRWRALAARQDWIEAGRSVVRRIDNIPPGEPVVLPKGAPQPRITLPPQPRARTAGPDPVITSIPDRIWREMVGRTWHAGCPVGRSGLRLLRINYFGYDGYRHRGELVAATGVVTEMADALSALYLKRLPIRSLYREDRFGWSSRLQGADDYKSMAAGNSSAFNCRHVVGRPGVRSPHAYGRALDLNTWENPFRSAQGTVPNAWWQSRSNPRYAWRSRDHLVVRTLAAHGLRWTYGLSDTQHFSA